MIVADEDVAKLRPHAPAFTWIFDITDETNPIPIASWQVEGLDLVGEPQSAFTGCHQPQRNSYRSNYPVRLVFERYKNARHLEPTYSEGKSRTLNLTPAAAATGSALTTSL